MLHMGRVLQGEVVKMFKNGYALAATTAPRGIWDHTELPGEVRLVAPLRLEDIQVLPGR
jgi:hypothetical protein